MFKAKYVFVICASEKTKMYTTLCIKGILFKQKPQQIQETWESDDNYNFGPLSYTGRHISVITTTVSKLTFCNRL